METFKDQSFSNGSNVLRNLLFEEIYMIII